MIDFLSDNWQYILFTFFVLEKIVKLTPTKYDDILLDIVWGAIKKIASKK